MIEFKVVNKNLINNILGRPFDFEDVVNENTVNTLYNKFYNKFYFFEKLPNMELKIKNNP